MSFNTPVIPTSDSELKRTQKNEIQSSPLIHATAISSEREHDISTLKLCAETSTQEYNRLLKLRQSTRHETEDDSLSRNNDSLDARITELADITLDDLRALESKLCEVYAHAENCRRWRWLRALIIFVIVPITRQFMSTIFPRFSKDNLSSSITSAIIVKARYITRGVASIFGNGVSMNGYFSAKAIKSDSKSETYVQLNMPLNGSVANITIYQLLASYAKLNLSILRRLYMSLKDILLGKTTKPNSSVETLNTKLDDSFPSPILSTTTSLPASELQIFVRFLEQYYTHISIGILLFTVLYVVGVEVHIRVIKEKLKMTRMCYAAIEKNSDVENRRCLREELTAWRGWYWNFLLLGYDEN